MKPSIAKTNWVTPPSGGPSKHSDSNQWFLFRNTLVVEDPAAVSAAIAVDSKYWLYINGQLVVKEGGLKRGPTPDGSYYDVVDLSGYVHQGENTVAVKVWYFGRDSFAHRDSGSPGLLFEGSGSVLRGSWKTLAHPAYFDPGYVQDAFRLSESSIGFDARRDIPDWADPEFDDSAWAEAVPAGKAGDKPWGSLEMREFPQWYWSEPKDYENVEVLDTGLQDGFTYYKCKLPYNAHFVPLLELEAEEGIAITIHVALDTVRQNCHYITKSGKQSHEFEGWLNGEVVIYRIPSDAVREIRLQYRETSFPAEFVGEFKCENPILNSLWTKSRRTLLVTMRDNFMDCPCRERAQWPGDLVVQLGQVPYCLDRTADLLVRKALREMLRWQRPDGVIYGPVPEGNWKCELPAQMLSVISPYGLWTYFLNTGDTPLLEELYPFAKRYLDIWQFHENGLIKYRPDKKGTAPVRADDEAVGVWDWIDWGEDIDDEACLNFWFILAAQGVRLMAEKLGHEKDLPELASKIESVTDAARKNFWDSEQGAYLTPGFEAGPDDRAQALAVVSGVATDEQYESLTAQLGSVFRSCPYMERYVLEALFKMGSVREALERMESRYKSMVEGGTSTLWERWPEVSNHPGTINHSWSGGPLTLLSEKVAGISPLEPGWKGVRVSPRPGSLQSIESKVSCPGGEVYLRAKLESGAWNVSLTLPPDTEAELDFSALGSKEGITRIKESRWRASFPQ